jgi:2-dehydropantoate 2-reductase
MTNIEHRAPSTEYRVSSVVIFGVGAMGCLFGAKLSPHAEVTLVGHWADQMRALNADGLRLQTADGEERHALRATDDPSQLAPADLALILVKAAGTEQAARDAARVLKPDGLALTLQNGLGNLEVIARHVGQERAALGVTIQGAAVLEPGLVRHAGSGPTTLATRPEIETQIEATAALFRRAGLETHVAADVDGLVWGKLAVNAGINAPTAILRVTNGALLDSSWSRDLMIEAARETAAVAAALEIALPYEDAGARVVEVARVTGPNRSSMLQDVLRGAPTEVETINGAVMREGERLGVPTPVNAMLYRMVKAIEGLAQSRVDG